MTEQIVDNRAKTGPMTGNIVLIQSYGNTVAEQEAANIVKWATDGPYVHAAVIIDEALNIVEARLDGVHYGKLATANNGVPIGSYQICAIRTANKDDSGTVISLDLPTLNRAIAWLRQQADRQDAYGWCDIADQGLDVIFGQNHPRIVQQGRFDCSNLAATFLLLCGIKLPFALPLDVSPNDLAEFFGLLPQRHRVYP